MFVLSIPRNARGVDHRRRQKYCHRLLIYSILLEPPHTLEYACDAVEEELGQSCSRGGSLEGTMFQSRIAEWSYYLGFVSAAAALVYRALWFGTLGARLFGASRVLPHNLLELSILLFVTSIASNVRATSHR